MPAITATLAPNPAPACLYPACAQPTDKRTPWYAEITSQALAAITADRNAVGGIKGALQFQGWVEVRRAGGGGAEGAQGGVLWLDKQSTGCSARLPATVA